jgi:hypothetical protein
LQESLPFAGLGFDLAPVLARAGLLSWRSLDAPEQARLDDCTLSEPLAGFALLVWLGREIRGR